MNIKVIKIISSISFHNLDFIFQANFQKKKIPSPSSPSSLETMMPVFIKERGKWNEEFKRLIVEQRKWNNEKHVLMHIHLILIPISR